MMKVKRTVLVYMVMIRKRMFVFSSSNKFLDSKFEITDKNINSVSIAQDKAIEIIKSCKTADQLLVAQKYVGLLYARHPFASVIYRILLKKINNFLLNPMTLEDGTIITNPLFSEDDINRIYLSQDQINGLITDYSK